MSELKYLKVGDKAPAFEASIQNGERINSSNLAGKKWVLYFYPKDSTPGCTAQACSIRDGYDVLQKEGISIFGVSADSEQSHVKFIDKQKLPFPLIADVDLTLIKLYGVWGTKKFMGKVYDGIHRTTFLIDETGTIVSIIDKPNTKDHANEILKNFNINL